MADGQATDLHLPSLTISAGADGLRSTLPSLRVVAPGVTGVLPSLTIDATAPGSTYNAVAGSLPLLTISSGSSSGLAGSVIKTLPMLVLFAGNAPTAALVLPSLDVTATAKTGWLGVLASSLPSLDISGTILPSGIATGSPILPSLRVSGSGIQNGFGTLVATFRAKRLVASGFSGSNSTMSKSLPHLTGAATGYGIYTLSAAGILPALSITADGEGAVLSAYRTWVLNTRKKALTEYDSTFQFNSYAVFQGVVLAAGPNGLFKQTGEDNDAGAPIVSVVRTGKNDFGTSMNKRVPRIYVGIDCPANLHFSTITTQGGKRTYAMPGNQMVGIQQRRVPIGRGAKSPYWQYEMTNPDGTDFLLEHFQVRPEKSFRRVV